MRDTVQAKGACIRLLPERMELGEIELAKLSDSFGQVRFEVQNDGTAPLILRSVSGCCGTDIKDYTKAPILPGKKGEILVEFRLDPKPQAISRTVTVVSNAVNAPTLAASIVGAVIRNREKGKIIL